MKKIVIAIFALFVLPLSLNAQDYKQEFSVSYGAYSSSIIYHVFVHEMFNDSDPLRDARNDWALGPVSIEYYRRVSPLWSFGAIGANSDLFYDVYYNGEKRQDVRVYNFTAMAAAKLHWLNGQHFNMYSKAALGVLLKNAGPSIVLPNFQLSLLGMEVMFTRQFGIFVEAGIGEQGIVHGGMCFKM